MITRNPSGVRCFAALEYPSSLRDGLARILAGLERRAPEGAVRWVRPEGIHLTVQFFGDVAPARLPDLQAALHAAAARTRPLALGAAGLGAFPALARPRVVWVGVTGDLAGVQQLQTAVAEACAPLGFAPEARDFSPHLTLGRVRDRLHPDDLETLAAVLAETRVEALGDFTASELSLIRSQLRPDGSVYTRLSSAPLAGATL